MDSLLKPLNGLLHLIYPLHCAVCETPIEQNQLCFKCENDLRPLPLGHCFQCGQWIGGSATRCLTCVEEMAYSGFCYGLYEETKPLAMLIQKLKYRGDRGLIPLLGELLFQVSVSAPQPDLITFVPMQKRRQRQRGYNQAELLAKDLSESLDVAVQSLLAKIKKTKPQAALQRRERLINLEHAFVARPCDAQTVWLIDDVRTTGATLRACAKALKDAGVTQVVALTLAAALPPKGVSNSD